MGGGGGHNSKFLSVKSDVDHIISQKAKALADEPNVCMNNQ